MLQAGRIAFPSYPRTNVDSYACSSTLFIDLLQGVLYNPAEAQPLADSSCCTFRHSVCLFCPSADAFFACPSPFPPHPASRQPCPPLRPHGRRVRAFSIAFGTLLRRLVGFYFPRKAPLNSLLRCIGLFAPLFMIQTVDPKSLFQLSMIYTVLYLFKTIA